MCMGRGNGSLPHLTRRIESKARHPEGTSPRGVFARLGYGIPLPSSPEGGGKSPSDARRYGGNVGLRRRGGRPRPPAAPLQASDGRGRMISAPVCGEFPDKTKEPSPCLKKNRPLSEKKPLLRKRRFWRRNRRNRMQKHPVSS